ncbi:conserved hypothetical protein [Ricinus communis]|uniref:Orc1-like AAA ATPase domain-containing protein n=1 Tax=Ricinus communis TaxID=3988 RepID=B9T930_RICCO|nr:conserved hypothetical protein [Ricinus communis]
MILLAKTPEGRYQTARDAASDFRGRMAAYTTDGHITPFELASNDTSEQLVITEKLRSARRAYRMLGALDDVFATGRPVLALISGHSGIGKSTLVDELYRSIFEGRGLFASGKFDQPTRNIPCAPLARAFQVLIRQILGQSDAPIGYWRRKLRSEPGTNAQLMVDLIPDLEFVIDAQPPVPEVQAAEARVRFQRTMRAFISVFGRPHKPLTLFLDDLQWLDDATLTVLESLICSADSSDLLVIGAYRSNDVGRDHLLTQMIDRITGSSVKVR